MKKPKTPDIFLELKTFIIHFSGNLSNLDNSSPIAENDHTYCVQWVSKRLFQGKIQKHIFVGISTGRYPRKIRRECLIFYFHNKGISR